MANHPTPTAPALTKLLYDLNEAGELLSIGRTALYEEITSGRLRSVKRGKSRLIPADALLDYVALLQNEARAEVA
ncbi:helix-turn-helix domain-containing protein [Actinomadura kijaniata]|uniref:helix-turn-helix domain-containing protein n=1 Tax=Actinomadura kijaniata TaxID=46161 RepID=UPI0008326DC4|nr:helix-turn-helix domain-containing protein [Actinomadura kijaniata]